jgi:hypothetical protein
MTGHFETCRIVREGSWPLALCRVTSFGSRRPDTVNSGLAHEVQVQDGES